MGMIALYLSVPTHAGLTVVLFLKTYTTMRPSASNTSVASRKEEAISKTLNTFHFVICDETASVV
jgi:hypothetical protein